MIESNEDIDNLRLKIRTFNSSLSKFFINKEKIINLMTLCSLAFEPLLIVGPPGTAKSDLILKFRDAVGIEKDDYFEYTLTKFTEPSEVMGPIDIVKLREGKYIRRVQGKVPTAKMVFLDEIFKSNSAILNSLLTIMNEKKYYQDGKPEKAALKILFAASNEIPENEELNALKDRFCLKVMSHPVQDTHFLELIDMGVENSNHASMTAKPWMQNHLNLEDIEKVNSYLIKLVGNVEDRKVSFSESIMKEMRRMIRVLSKEDAIIISDRKLIKLYRLIRINSWLRAEKGNGIIEKEDLRLLSYLGDTMKEVEILENKVPNLLGLD